MVDKMVTIFQNTKREIVSNLSGTVGLVLNETDFYDTGYVRSQIKRIQLELNQVVSKLKGSLESEKSSQVVNDYRAELMNRKKELTFCFIFWASNSISKLNDCIEIAGDYEFDIIEFIYGLCAYRDGRDEEAFNALEKYYMEHGSVSNHFLVNKVFGLLLMKNGRTEQAISFLKYALQFSPSDEECLQALKNGYGTLNNINGINTVAEILEILS